MNCLTLEKKTSALRLGSVGTARSFRLRLNTYSSSIQPVRTESSAQPSCHALAPSAAVAWRLRNIPTDCPSTIHSKERWLRDLGDPAPVGRGLVVGADRAGHGLFLEIGDRGKGDPGRGGCHSRAPGCLFASEAPTIEAVASPSLEGTA